MSPAPDGRTAEVAAKLDRVRGWLTGSGYGAALFTSQPGVAWVTGGLEDRVVRNEEPALVWALVTETAAFLITTNIEQPRLRAEADLGGFELHAVPWYSSGGLAEVAGSLADGQKLTEAPAALRMPLVAAETDRLAALGADCAQALEGAMRAWRPTDRECDLAARIAAALEERLIFGSVLLVGGAERRRAFRHPVPSRAVTGSDVLAVVVGVRGGLNVACSRSASAGAPDPGLAARHEAACAVEAAMITATSPGWRWADVLRAGQAAYRDAGFMFGMGRDRTVPPALGRVNSRFRTPVAGLVVMGVIPVVALILYLASASLQKTIVYIDSTGGLLFASYYVVISLYSIWYYRTVLLRNVREFVLGLLLPLVGAGTLVYVIVKSLPGTATPVKIIALVLFLVGIPLAWLSKAITRAPFFTTRRERYTEETPEPVGSGRS